MSVNRDDVLTPPPPETLSSGGRILQLLERHEDLDRQILAGVQRLVELEERRDGRETAALEAEQHRLEASAEAQTRRVAVELAEQQARGVWVRDQLGRLVVPVVGILTALGAAVTAWASGLFSGRQP